jgi:hypothetical protein
MTKRVTPGVTTLVGRMVKRERLMTGGTCEPHRSPYSEPAPSGLGVPQRKHAFLDANTRPQPWGQFQSPGRGM